MRRVALMLPLSLLAACNVHSKNPDEKVTINADDSGRVEFNLPFVNGSMKLPEGMMHNGDFDIDGVKMVPGGSITGVSVNAGDKAATVNIAFKAPGSPEQVRAYFVDQFKQKGVEASASGTSVSGKTRDGDDFTIDVQPAARGSEGRITVLDND